MKLCYLNQTSINNKRKSFLYRLFYKVYESYWLNKRYKDKDFILFNNSPHFPLFKRKNTCYIKVMHEISKGRYLRRYNTFDALVLVSSGELEFWQKHHKNVVVIPNFLSNIPQERTDYAQKCVLSIGRMTDNDEKGFKRLLEIWNLVCKQKKDWKLRLIGEGEGRGEIEAKISKLHLEDFVSLGDFTDKIAEEYLKSSIYCLTSYRESFGMVIVESASFGLPCVAFDILTGPRDIIEDGRSGFLIADGDLQEYARVLMGLMEDFALRKQIGESARARVIERFSQGRVMQKWEEVFKISCD